MKSNIDLRIAPQAERDIAAILRYTNKIWGKDQEQAYETILRESFQRIQSFPEIGRPTKRLNDREYVLPHHIVVYRFAGGTLTILRVVNPRRNRRQ